MMLPLARWVGACTLQLELYFDEVILLDNTATDVAVISICVFMHK
jgi:hypothetical protein